MSPLRALRAGLSSLFRREQVDRDLDDEARFYIEEATRENLRAGMSPEGAARAARVAFGSVETVKEDVRRSGWEAGIDTTIQDVRYAIRGLRRNPGFTLIAALTLALGIGANTAMFSVVNTVMLRPLPYRDAVRVTMIWTNDTRRALPREGTAFATISDWQRDARAFSDIGFFGTQRALLISDNLAEGRERAPLAFVSGNLFSVLGTSAAKGRTIGDEDATLRAPVVVISHSLWQRQFGGRDDIVGRQVTLDAGSRDGPARVTIVGVMPADFYFPNKQIAIWTPVTTYWRFDRESTERHQPWARRWTAVGRLAPDVSAEDAQRNLDGLAGNLTKVHPTSVPDFPGFRASVIPMLNVVAGTNLQTTLWTLLGAVALVLLVACANVANLLLARGAARQQEFAIRRALGASRVRIVRQLVIESLALALIGGAVGALVANWGTRLLAVAASAYVPRIDEIRVDGTVLTFAALASVIAGLVFGLVPAFRVSSADANTALREGSRGTGSVRIHRSRGALVVAECAMAIVLLTGAGLLVKSLMRLQSIDAGFDPRGVLTMRIELPSETAPPGDATRVSAATRAQAQLARMEDLVERMGALPGVETVGITDDLFLAGAGNESITIPGRQDTTAGELAEVLASPGFFGTLRVPVRQGRPLTREDGAQKIRALFASVVTDQSLADKERNAVSEPTVVNEAFVQRFFPNENPIGKRFCIDPTNKTYWYEIVGVVGDMRRGGLARRPIPEYYSSHVPAASGRADLLIRVADGDPLALAPAARQLVMSAIPGALITTVSTADAGLGAFDSQRRFQTTLLGSFALLALALAAIGIYGLVHYAVTERTREFGIRIALGASTLDVARNVVSQGMRMPLIGIAIGLGLAVATTRVLASVLFDVGATDPATFLFVGLGLVAVAALACFFPARRAMRVDPGRALRGE